MDPGPDRFGSSIPGPSLIRTAIVRPGRDGADHLGPYDPRSVTSMSSQSASVAGQPAGRPSGRVYPPPGRPEALWHAQLTVAVAIALQLLLPSRLTAGPHWLLPAFEATLLIGLAVTTPRRLVREHVLGRRLALTMTGVVSLANITSLTLLSHDLLKHATPNGRQLIVSGVLIWLTNVVIFGLWYWETDRGGPGPRAAGHDGPPDFLFPQMSDDRVEPIDWRPQFIDYLYVSLTNATAFSPTDTAPLTPRAKAVMGLQSLVSLVTLGLIVARAVNILH